MRVLLGRLFGAWSRTTGWHLLGKAIGDGRVHYIPSKRLVWERYLATEVGNLLLAGATLGIFSGVCSLLSPKVMGPLPAPILTSERAPRFPRYHANRTDAKAPSCP